MKKVIFEGDALLRIRSFPEAAKQRAGYEINRVQQDKEPENCKPFSTIGQGVREICIHVNGHYRVLYVETSDHKVHVLHVFEKKTQKTRQADIDLARSGLKNLSEGKVILTQEFNNVWDAIEDNSVMAENLRLRSQLMMEMSDYVKQSDLTQAKSAAKHGTTQPRLNDVLNGRIEKCTVDRLVNMLAAVGFKISMQIDRGAV